MTADLSTVKYKREPVPAIADEQKLKTYFSDELQRVENTLNNHETIVQSVSTEVDGNKGTFNSFVQTQATANAASASSVTALSAVVSTKNTTFTRNAAPTVADDSIVTGDLWIDSDDGNKLYRWDGTTWVPVRDDGIAANAAESVLIAGNLTAEATARANADAATTKVVNAQRALFGAAVGDTWVSGANYTGSVNTDTPAAATGDEVVVSGIVYRARQTHTAAAANKPANTEFWDAVDTVDAKVAAGVVTASAAHTTAGYAAAGDVTELTTRMTAVDGDGENAGDVFNLNASIATTNGVISTDRDNTSARFGITVSDNYDDEKTYAVGEYAVDNALLYICIQAATGKIPASQPQYWTVQTTVAADVAAAITTERAVRVIAEEAIAERTDVVSARIGVPPTGGTNFDSSRQYAIDDEVVHNSGKVYKVTATPPVGTVPTNTSYWSEQSLLSATVTLQSEALVTLDGKVNTRHQILLDSDGYVSGVKLSNDGATSDFRVLADHFVIQTPGTDKIPFEVDNGVVRMQNVEIGSNVLGLNSSTNVHHSNVATAYVTLQNFSAYTQIGILTFTPTTTGVVLYEVNFNNSAVTSSNTLTASCRVTYGVELRLTVGSGSTIILQGMSNLNIGGLLTGHFGNSALRTITASAVGQLHTYEVYARPTQLLNGAVKLGIHNAALSATELYR